MKKRERTVSASVATLLALGFSVSASADESQFYGLLRERDLTTFGFLRLDMRPSHAVSIETGTWALEAGLGYQNTWALSEEVEKYLTAREPLSRRALGPDDERTYAAWLRTGLAALASGAGAHSLLEDVVSARLNRVVSSVLLLFAVVCFGAAAWREMRANTAWRGSAAPHLAATILCLASGALTLISLVVMVGVWRRQ